MKIFKFQRFIEAAETYKNLLEYSNCGKPKGDAERVLQIPNWLTVFHDASIANLLAGNLVEAEKIALKAVNQYLPEEYPSNFKESSSLLDKDVNWLQKTIEEELLEIDIVSKKVKNDITYSENLIYFLPENVIALLILSEVQRIQDAEEYTTTLKQLFSCFSNYLAKVIKKEDLNEREKQILCIVKALASKTCLRIANVQIQHGNTTNTEKMFKRSLSCNKGDKDVLHDYCKFLIGSGKKREASKLWCTFCSEAPAIALDSVQSLSLRYFLSSKVTNGDLEKLQKELQIN